MMREIKLDKEMEALENFLRYCNVQESPAIQKGLFL